MKIENKVSLFVKFSELDQGDVFLYEDEVCIKTDDDDVNAVSLSDGRSMQFFGGDTVYKVNAILTVEKGE